MADNVVTPIRPPAKKRTPRKVAVRYRTYSEIEHDLNQVKCTLACASAALGKAQDEEDGDLAVQSWVVINDCVHELGRIENELDSWHVSHEHSPKSPKEVTDGPL